MYIAAHFLYIHTINILQNKSSKTQQTYYAFIHLV